MKLQLSCDLLSIDEAQKLIEETIESVDIIEMGTPFILKNGLQVVKIFKEQFPEKTILADMKIMDGGYEEAQMAFESGADIVTVLAVASINTIQKVIQCCRKYNRQVMVDMIEVVDIKKRVELLDTLDPDYICVHTAVDNQLYDNPLAELALIKSLRPSAKIAVAGGIKLETIDDVIGEKPDIIIVGGGIVKASSPGTTARAIKNKILSAV